MKGINGVKLGLVFLAVSSSSSYAESEMYSVTLEDISRSDIKFSSVERKNYYPDGFDYNVVPSVDPLTLSAMSSFILDKAQSAIFDQAGSLIFDAIFGGGSSPQFVRLHQQALDEINNIVRDNILTSELESAKSDLKTLGELLNFYHESVRTNNPDFALLSDIKGRAFDLKNHRVYRSTYNQNAKLLTASYALTTSLVVAIITEEYLHGKVTKGFVAGHASELKGILSQLGNSADSYISHRIVMMTDKPISYCWSGCVWQVHDHIKGGYKSFPMNQGDIATSYRNQKINSYKDDIKGNDYDNIITRLNSLSRM
ncbi:hypothetical protein A7985_08130 [Pseudoalteromonas luteoviolacea]|uniref:Uncharacterized protein n=1 Tax=Pseudoalteromonas luteoviolacea TaxID=43657 RepID=A0A1C0TX41_9GAMM|nr:hypothetical protein [Pseudoalteromonas luteoviolacea]MBQ4810399.1 hypothetical protein [Pseudoalteromonas luteoviolacea]OCQ23895.1 hypothetical protein A7985_08130 [Pseudoalteromonas luteoviolacea]